MGIKSDINALQPSERYKMFKQITGTMRKIAEDLIGISAVGSIEARRIFTFSTAIVKYRAQLGTIVGSGAERTALVEYAKVAENNQNDDLVADYQAFQTVIDDWITWVDNYAAIRSGKWLNAEETVGGILTGRQLAPASTGEFRTEAQKIVDAIDA